MATPYIKQGGDSCAAYGCHNRRYVCPNLSFFRFPKDKERCKKWIINTRRGDLDKFTSEQLYQGYNICAEHFEKSQFMNEDRKKLIWNAIPTLFDAVPNPPETFAMKRPLNKRFSNPPPDVSSPEKKMRDEGPQGEDIGCHLDTSPQAEARHRSVAPPETPRKKKLKREVAKLRTRVHRLEKKIPQDTSSEQNEESAKNEDNAGHVGGVANDGNRDNSGNLGNEDNRDKKGKKGKSRKIDKLISQLQQYLPEETVEFIKTQLIMSKRSKYGYRWGSKDKMLALSIFYHSRKAYKLLQRVFCLPSKRTLQRSLAKTNIAPGFNDNVFSALKVKIDTLSTQDKTCALVFDEMSLKCGLVYNPETDSVDGFENFGDIGQTKYVANHALAFMVRGLSSKWKQPVGYFLSSGTVSAEILRSLVQSCISKLTKAGLDVKVLICDQGSNNRSFLETLMKVSTTKPFFVHDKKKVHVIYDPPHLLKNVRNNLMKHNLLFNGQTVKWKHIVDFYNFDKMSSVRMAPKITEKHVTLPPFAAMRVCLASQIFSHSVASGIAVMSRLKVLPADAKHTANFVDVMDKLFNTFNSSSVSSSQPFRHAIQPNSGHITLLTDVLGMFESLMLPSGKVLPCFKGWQMSIRSLLALWDYLKVNHGFSFFLTNHLNQDCIENMFSIIRGKGGCRDNPDPEEFRSAFRQVIVSQLLVQSDRSNCIADFDKVLLDLTTISKTVPNVANTSSQDENCVDNVEMAGVELLDVIGKQPTISEQNTLTYIAGYLLRKTKLIACNECKSVFTHDTPPEDMAYELVKQKAFKVEGTLIYSSQQFTEFVKKIEIAFNYVFPSVMHMVGVIQKLSANASRYIKECQLVTCGDKDCDKKLQGTVLLFMKMRVHHALRMSNVENQAGGKGIRRNRKLLKLMHQ